MFLQETGLNVVPGGIIPVMHVSQYDVGRELKFVLYSGYDYASLESGTTVTIEGTKPDGHGFQYSGVLDQNAHTATFVTTEQMTVLAGAIECKLTLYLNSQRIGTALFILDVEKAGITDSTIISDTELPLIIAQATEQMERAEAAADAAALSETNAATSETNAAASETNAANSEIICGSFMRMAGASAASAEQSAIISGSFMRTAGNYADDAEASAASANVDALKSEGHALGTQNGTPVSSDSPYYHNNAKYWADEARQSSAGGVAASVIATAEPTNISSHAYAIGDQFVYNGILYTATSAISVGADIIPGTNCSISDTITEQIGNAGHTILDEDGTTYPQRSKLQFEGCEITDDAVNGVTVIETTPDSVGAVDVVEYEEDIYGVNLIPYPYYHTTRTSNGVTFTDNGDGSVTLNGTATAEVTFYLSAFTNIFEEGSYILSGCPSGGNRTNGYYLEISGRESSSSSWQVLGTDTGDGASINISKSQANWEQIDIFIRMRKGKTVTNLTFNPMLRKATIKDDTYRPYNQQSIQHQLTDQTNVLGAKNLFNFDTPTLTSQGITFANSGGIITANGTSGSSAFPFIECRKTIPAGTYTATGCPSGGGTVSEPNNYAIIWRKNSGGTVIGQDYGDGATFTLTEETVLNCRCLVSKDSTYSNITFKPMIRLASDPDDTYAPPAMTNRELTDEVTNAITLDSTNDLNNITRTGIYYFNSAPTNSPESKAHCMMIVSSRKESPIDLKQLVLSQQNTIYTRSHSTDGWTSWYKFTGTVVS